MQIQLELIRISFISQGCSRIKKKKTFDPDWYYIDDVILPPDLPFPKL